MVMNPQLALRILRSIVNIQNSTSRLKFWQLLVLVLVWDAHLASLSFKKSGKGLKTLITGKYAIEHVFKLNVDLCEMKAGES